MALTLERLSRLRARIETIGRGFGVSDVRVFGSVARGTATDNSDIDLLVRLEPGRSLLDLIGFEESMAALIGVRVDVVTENGIHPRLEPSILREAQPL